MPARKPFDRILIVTEGSKTEPNYFNEMSVHYRLPSTNVRSVPSGFGTDPLSVVNYAEHLFVNGEERLSIEPKSFEQVYAVFDRDDHLSYHPALGKAGRLGRQLRNDLRQQITFEAFASIPNFELWLLLHYENVIDPLHRNEVMHRLKGYLPDYEKGQEGLFGVTRPLLDIAIGHAQALEETTTRHDDGGPYTDVHTLVDVLINLRKT